jgi:agmatinase
MKIVSVPMINALGLKGPEEAPEKILSELDLDSEKVEIDNSDIKKSGEAIYSKSKDIFGKEERVVFIGGDHSITFPIFKAFQEEYNDPFLIVFDAHADCMSPMKEPTHEEFLRGIIENGFSPENVILIGVRKIEREEKKFLEEKGIKVFSEIYDLEAVGDFVTEKALGKDIYVSVDIDVLDPSFAPGVSYSEPNGLLSKELFYLLRRIFRIKSLKALDVVEVIPSKDLKYDYRTVKVAAKIIDDFLKS